MRKFKHKQSGQIVTENKDGLFVSQHGGYKLQKWIFENSNDWEEVKYNVISNMDVKEETLNVKKMMFELDKKHVPHLMKEEPNYLITGFIDSSRNIYKIDRFGNFQYGFNILSLNQLITDYKIYSVKNSTGFEWKLGDKFDTKNYKNLVINKFEIINNIIGVYTDGKHGFLELDWLINPKTHIYTTTDGKEIFEGDKVSLFIYTKNGNKFEAHIPSFDKSEAVTAKAFKCFISEENRDKYIKENQRKPIFTSADGKGIFEGDTIYIIITSFNDNSLIIVEQEYDRWENMFTENKQYNNVFSTKELAQEYIDNNKPKYSLSDIEKMWCDESCSLWEDAVEYFKKLGK